MKSPDTWWSMLRWRMALWFIYRGVALAPDGDAAVALEDVLLDWGAACTAAWYRRYPVPEKEPMP